MHNDEDEELLKNFESRINPQLYDFPEHQRRKISEQNLLKGVSLETKSQDVYIWIKNTLREWGKAIEEKYTAEDIKGSYEGTRAIGTYRQSVEYLKPLLKLLRNKNVNEEIMDALFHISH